MNLSKYIILILFVSFTNQTIFSQTAVAGDDQEICTNQTILNADPAPSGYTGTWSIVGGSCTIQNITSYNTEITNVISGYNELKWTISNGIITDEDLVIITNNTPSQAQTETDKTICEDSYTLTANPAAAGETGLWTKTYGSGILSTPSTNSTMVNGLAFGDNVFKWSIKKGICSSSAEITLTNYEIHADAGSNQTTCDDYTTLSAVEPIHGTGTWSVVSSSGNIIFDNIHAHNSTISGLGINTNSLQWTVNYDICSDYENVIITSHKPTDANAGTDKIICDNYTTLSANNPTHGTGSWSVISGNGNFTNSNNYNTQVNSVNIGNNTYDWTINYFACTSSDQVNIFYDYFTADAGSNEEICTDLYTLNANDPGTSTGKWRVTGGSGNFDNISLYNTTVHDLVIGENTFEWTITKGNCTQTGYVTITKNSPSQAAAGANQEICGFSTTLTATEPITGNGYWSVISGSGIFANSLQSNTAVNSIGLNENIYRWTVDYLSCSNYDDLSITNNYVTADAGTDQTLCGTNSFLNGNEPITGAVGKWTVFTGTSYISDSNNYNSSVSALSFGINKFRWTISKGICSDFDEIEITNNQYYASASVSGLSEICVDYAEILGNIPPAGGIGKWTVESGNGIVDNSIDHSTFVRNLDLGVNTIRWTIDYNSCIDFDDFSITRNTIYAEAGENKAICTSTTQLAANQPNTGITGLWTNGGGTGTIITPTAYNTEVQNIGIGLNSYIWTISGFNCSDQDFVEITNNAFSASAGVNQIICNSSTILDASMPAEGTAYWEIISSNGVIADYTLFNTTINNISDNSTNIFRWHVSQNNCTAYDDVTITNNFVSADAGTDISVCEHSAQLNAVQPVAGYGKWTVQSGSGTFSDKFSNSTFVSNVGLDFNTFRWTVQNVLCYDYDDVTVTNNYTTAFAGEDQELCENSTQLSANQPPVTGSGLWEIVSGNVIFANQSLFNTQITNIASGINILKWTVFKNGCESTPDEIIVNNKEFQAFAGDDQNLEPFITTGYLNADLPENAVGTWLLVGGGGTISDDSDPNTQVSNMPTGINQFMWTVFNNNCFSDDIVNITVINFSPNAGNDRFICDDNVVMAADDFANAIKLWTVIEGSGTFSNPDEFNSTVNNVGFGTNIYRWSVTIDGASNYDDVNVTRVYSDAGIDQQTCTNSVTLEGNIPVPGCNGFWAIIAGSGSIINETNYLTEVQNIDFMNNVFEWTIQTQECLISDFVSVYNYQVTAEAGEDQTVTTPDTYLDATAPSNSNTELWSVISGTADFFDVTNPKTYVSNLSEGDNILRWTVSNEHCTDFDEVKITYFIDHSGITNADNNFTIYPNPINDQFYIIKNVDGNYSVKISDITGKLVLSKENISEKNINYKLSNETSGIYIVEIKHGFKNIIFKIIKQ